MFVSEVSEAQYHGFTKVSQNEISESNDVFSDLIGRYIHKSNQEIYDILKTEYGRFGNTNRIAKYNSKRIFIR